MLRSSLPKVMMLALSGLLASSGTAMADDDYWRGRSALRELIRCALTRPAHFDGTIAEAAAHTEALSTLSFALQQSGLEDALDGSGPLTVYAPTNDAFAALPPEVLDFLLANPTTELASVLLLHVSTGEGRYKDPRRVFSPREVKTLNGQTVFYNRGPDGPQVNQSNVACQPVRTSNGTVFIIDSVLKPQALQDTNGAD